MIIDSHWLFFVASTPLNCAQPPSTPLHCTSTGFQFHTSGYRAQQSRFEVTINGLSTCKFRQRSGNRARVGVSRKVEINPIADIDDPER